MHVSYKSINAVGAFIAIHLELIAILSLRIRNSTNQYETVKVNESLLILKRLGVSVVLCSSLFVSSIIRNTICNELRLLFRASSMHTTVQR